MASLYYNERHRASTYKWRQGHKEAYLVLQRKYRLKQYYFQKAWKELLNLGDLFST